LGLFGSAFIGLLTGSWAASRKITLYETKMAAHDDKLAELEAFKLEQAALHAKQKADQTAFCTKQKEELLEVLRKDICSIVKLAIKDMVIEHNGQLSNLDKNVALIAQSNGQMEKNIEEIFRRLNRRDSDHLPGQERRSA
jgi:hypothetical protein